jgi:UDP-glucose 4-epimerase
VAEVFKVAVLVTGGAGYIGSHTLRALRSTGRDVVALDTLELGSRSLTLGAPLVVGDTSDAALVQQVIQEFSVDAIIHFAAYKNPGDSMIDPGKYFANNVGGSLALMEAARNAGLQHFVLSSTCAVYGTPQTVPVREDAPLAPESPYGASKAMVEQMLRWFAGAHGLRSVALRYFNAAGASSDAAIGEDWTHTMNLVPLAAKATLGKAPALRIFGADYPTADGTCIRDYIHVEDLAEAHVAALDYLEGGGERVALNLGTGVGSSVLEVVRQLGDVAGVEVPHEVVGRRAGDPVAVYADNSRAIEVLGWRPRRELRDILESAWKWHSRHPDGIAALA